MPLFTPLTLATASEGARRLLENTHSQLGRIPNLDASMAHSPVALQAYLAFRGALQEGLLSPRMREYIALLTAQLNECSYCVAAHTFRLEKMKESPELIAQVRRASSGDPKTAAALAFVQTMVHHQGKPPTQSIIELHEAGWTEAKIGEMVAHIALNVFSNYFNHVGQPPLDFPAVPLETGA